MNKIKVYNVALLLLAGLLPSFFANAQSTTPDYSAIKKRLEKVLETD